MDASFRSMVAQARRSDSLAFAALLPEESINLAFGAARAQWQGWVYSPAVTVWVFLGQCLSPDHSCRDAVAKLIAWLLAQGRRPCSPETSAYCSARDALPEAAVRELVRITAQGVEERAPPEWLWHGRRVRLVDGTTVTMPDTEANQAEYPQHGQAPGCGFPIARLVTLFSLATGVVLNAVVGKYTGKQTGENSLFRTLHDELAPSDVLLADRYFCGWFDLAMLVARGVDFVVRKHQRRASDYRMGLRLGPEDHVIVWRKPARPEWMSPEQYDQLPAELTIRELRVRVGRPGFRTRVLEVVTTLLDADEFTSADVAQLYRRRWEAELNLRSLKIVLQMDHLRCCKPHRVRNEINAHFIAYNLIRGAMAASAQEVGRPPWTISFKGTLQTLANLLPILASVGPQSWCDVLLAAIAAHRVGHRPDRIEPRRKKRRPKSYGYFRQSRREYRRQMAAGC